VFLHVTNLSIESFQEKEDEGSLLRICSSSNETYVESFTIHISQYDFEEPRSYDLHQCLSDVEDGIKNLMSIDTIEDMKNNMVHVDNDFIFNGTLVTTRLEYEQASLDSIKVSYLPDNVSTNNLLVHVSKVLFNYSDHTESPIRVNESISELMEFAKSLADDLPNLLYTNHASIDFQVCHI